MDLNRDGEMTMQQICAFIEDIPWKMNMEPKNHPIEKENHLPNLYFLGSMLIFRGVGLQVKQSRAPNEGIISSPALNSLKLSSFQVRGAGDGTRTIIETYLE